MKTKKDIPPEKWPGILEACLQAAPPVALTDIDGRIVRSNRGFSEAWGLAGSDATGGRPLAEFFEDGVTDGIEAVKSTGAWKGELRARKADGTLFWVEARLTRIPEDLISCHFTDLSGHRDLEKKIRAAQEGFQAAVDQMPFLFFMLGKDGRYMMANKMIQDFGGDMIGKSPGDIAPDDKTRKLWEDNNRRAFAGETLVKDDIYTVNGKQKTFHTVIAPFRHGDKIEAIAGISIDITERLETEEKLQMIQFSLDRAPESVFWVDEDAKFSYVNEGACRRMGYTREELISLGVADIDPAFPMAQWKEHRAEIKRKGSITIESVHKTKSGEEYPVEISINYIRYAGREYNCSIARDITERRRAERAIQENERFLQSVFDGIQDGISVLDKDMRIIRVNRWMEKMYKDQGAILGRKCYEVYHGRKRRCAVCPTAPTLKTGVPHTEEVPYTVKGRVQGWLELSAYPLHDASGEVTGVIEHVKDITAERKALQQLERSEERYRTLFESSRDGICAMDHEGRIVEANRALVALLGETTHDLLSRRYLDCVPKVWRKTTETHMRQAMERGYSEVFEAECARKDGERLPVAARLWKLPRESGKPGLWAIVRDITVRKQAEAALRESEQKFRSLAERSPNMIFINQGGRIVYANRRCEEIMGYSREELYSPQFDFRRLVAPESQKLVGELFARHTKGEEIPPYEYSIVTKSGEKLNAINSTRLMTYEGKRALLGIVTDVTERKRMEEELRTSEEKWRSLVENSPNVVAIIDRDCVIRFMSRTFSGAPPAPRIGKRISDFIIGEDRDMFIKAIGDAFESGRPGRVEVRTEVIEKGRRWLCAEIGPIRRGDEVEAVILDTSDVTEGKTAEAELWQAQKLASIGQLAAGVAHEINNPLSALSGELQWLRRRVDEEKILKSLDFLEKVSKRIARIVASLLTFSRAAPTESRELAYPNSIIEHVLALMERRLEKAGIQVVKKLPKTLPGAMLNRGQIEQVVMNLIMNSIYAMPSGGKLTLQTRAPKGMKAVEILVKDTGTGIPKKDLDRIFEPFFTTKPAGKGVGLGLSVSHGIVTKHGGEIRIESKPKKGTTVLLRLPLK